MSMTVKTNTELMVISEISEIKEVNKPNKKAKFFFFFFSNSNMVKAQSEIPPY